MKGYYVTKKRVQEYIDSVKHHFKSYKEFHIELCVVLKDLREFPNDHKNQIRFFEKVEDRVLILAMVEQMVTK